MECYRLNIRCVTLLHLEKLIERIAYDYWLGNYLLVTIDTKVLLTKLNPNNLFNSSLAEICLN